MKKRFCGRKILAMLFMAFSAFPASPSPAYAADTTEEAFITLNGQPSGIYAEMIDGKLYFSLRDYWEAFSPSTSGAITWDSETKTASNGVEYLSLEKQAFWVDENNMHSLADSAILKNGRILVASSYRAEKGTSLSKMTQTGNALDFYATVWERWDGETLNHRALLPPESIPLDAETGFPDWTHTRLSMFNRDGVLLAVDWDDLAVTKSEAEDGAIFFRYVSRREPYRSMLVTARNGYVEKFEEHNFVLPIEID